MGFQFPLNPGPFSSQRAVSSPGSVVSPGNSHLRGATTASVPFEGVNFLHGKNKNKARKICGWFFFPYVKRF